MSVAIAAVTLRLCLLTDVNEHMNSVPTLPWYVALAALGIINVHAAAELRFQIPWTGRTPPNPA